MDQLNNFLTWSIVDIVLTIFVVLVIIFLFRFFKEIIRSWIWAQRAKGVARRYMNKKKEEEPPVS